LTSREAVRKTLEFENSSGPVPRDLWILPWAEEIDAAIHEIRSAVWEQGGAIAQCEFGAAANPANVRQVFKSWAAEVL